MLRLRAAAVLLLVVAALAPPQSLAGTQAAPELTDAAGDQAITGGLTQVPLPVPGVNDETFDDVDLVAAWFDEPRVVDCVGEDDLDCPDVALVIRTTGPWQSTGHLTVTFKREKGPTSYQSSTSTGQTLALDVVGTTVTGLPNATARVSPEGLIIAVGKGRLGVVGGDLLTDLQLTAERTDPGLLDDPSLTQDDLKGSDSAGPGKAYTIFRPTPTALLDVTIASTNGRPGNAATLTARADVPVEVRVLNLGTDEDSVEGIVYDHDPATPGAKTLATIAEHDLPRGDAIVLTFTLAGKDLVAGSNRPVVVVTSRNGASDSAFAVIALDLPVPDRDVKPAGLDFLTPSAEGSGLDKAFGSYAELVILALLVLLVIVVVFLLVALAPSTLAGASAPEAPPMAGSDAPPAGVLPPTAAAALASARLAERDEADDDVDDTDDEPAPAPPPGTVGGALAIESVTHEPDAPAEGDTVTTIVLLRNPGPTRQVRVVLALDGADTDEAAVTLPARASKTARLSWTAGSGENRVKVRVLPA